jgi:hypothetical protein
MQDDVFNDKEPDDILEQGFKRSKVAISEIHRGRECQVCLSLFSKKHTEKVSISSPFYHSVSYPTIFFIGCFEFLALA